MKKVLIIPDCHVPFEDKRAFNLMLAAGKVFKPDTIVTMGDFGDFYSVSSHSKDPNRVRMLEEETAAVNKRLDQLDAIGAREKIFIEGNHEDRLRRYLADKAPEIYNTLTTKKLFKLAARKWRFIPYKDHVQVGRLYLTHDLGKAGQYAHYSALNDFQASVIIGHCLPWSYKVMTPTGPKPFADLNVGDDVLSYSNGKVVITKATEKVHYNYSGDMASFDNNAISMEMTSKHHIYTKDGRYIPVQDALETLTKEDLVTSAEPLDQPEFDVSDDMLKLIIAYCADGHVTYAAEGGMPHIRFHIKKERKIARLTQLIANLGHTLEWSKPTKTGSLKSLAFSPELRFQMVEMAPGKVLPQWLTKLSARQRQIVIEELSFWDGSVLLHDEVDYGCKQFCSYKAEEISLIQTLLTQHGIRSSLASKEKVITYNTEKKSYDVRRKLKEFVDWEKVENREVGCITTEFQNFFVMTDKGNVELSGNTHRLGYTVLGSATGKPHVGAMLGWLGDVKQVDYMHRIKAMRDWALGFGLAYVEPKSHNIHVTPVPIVDYKCMIEGRLIRG